MDKILNKALTKIYFDASNAASFGGLEKLYRAVKGRFTRKQVKAWLEGVDTYTLFKPQKTKFLRRRTMVSTFNEQFQADLVDMSHLKEDNDNYRYILTVIDVFSRRGWTFPLKNKKPSGVIAALKELFKESKPLKFQSDKGGEFTAKSVKAFLKEEQVSAFTTEDDKNKASICERWNRTVKTQLTRAMFFKNTKRYLDLLPDIVQAYNNSYHSSIRMAPNEVNDTNILEVWRNLYKPQPKGKAALNVGCYVRIARNKAVFEKGSNNWTVEIFKIKAKLNTIPVVYQIEDLNGDPISGTFYTSELQKVSKPRTFQVDKLLKTRRVNRKTQYYVSWRGYPKSFNSWIDKWDSI